MVFRCNRFPKKHNLAAFKIFIGTQKNEQLFYFGNSNQFVTELGQQTANPGAVAKFIHDKNGFEHQEFLPLPIQINPRKIIKLDDSTFLLSSNDDYVYLIAKKIPNE